MIISICGPSSSGKSTLISALKTYLIENPYQINKFPVIVNDFQLARYLLRITPTSWDDFKQIQAFQNKLLEFKITFDSSYLSTPQFYLVERNYLDLYVYYKLHAEKHRIVDLDFLEEYKKKCIREQQKQMGIFYLKNCPCLEYDGIRIVSEDYVQQQDVLFSTLLNTGKFKGVWQCYPIDPKERMDEFLLFLYQLKLTYQK